MKKIYPIFLLLFCLCNLSFSQGKFVIQNQKGTDKIKFRLIHNLIVIPVEINGVELFFLLDTGVSKPIIFNFLNVSDTLKIKDTETIFLRGLGEGESVEALKSKNNVFRIGDAIKLNQDLYAIYDTNLNFSPRLGVPIHGILGYDLFKDFVVEINYGAEYIRLTEPDKFRYKYMRKTETLSLEFYNKKPYINAKVKINNKQIPIKLLIDSGGSDSLWLFENDSLGIVSNKKYYDDFLGHGLSGSVYGKRSIIDEFSIKSFTFKDANVAYPDSSSISFARNFKDRNGTLAGNILKRFNVIMDYRNAIVTLKKNTHFKEKFTYNKSGIELAHNGARFVKERDRYVVKNNSNPFGDKETKKSTRIVFDTKYKFSLKPAYTIAELRKDSPAHRAGLQKGDIVLAINGKSTYQFSLQKLQQMFYDDDGKRIKMKVERNGMELTFTFLLENLFK